MKLRQLRPGAAGVWGHMGLGFRVRGLWFGGSYGLHIWFRVYGLCFGPRAQDLLHFKSREVVRSVGSAGLNGFTEHQNPKLETTT